MGDYFRFGLVFNKKSNQTEIFFKKKKTETGSNRLVSVRFGSARFSFLGQKLVQTGLTQFFRFRSVFARFFPVWLGFFSDSVYFSFFCLGSVRFSRFQTYETKTEPVIFFKILIGLIGFFSRFDFFGYFFLIFSIF